MPTKMTGVLVVFTIEMSGQMTVIPTGPERLFAVLASTAAVTVAVFEIEQQLASRRAGCP